jgi:hypothetical protein
MSMLHDNLNQRRGGVAPLSWCVAVLVCSLLLAACGPRTASTPSANSDGKQLVVELPAIVLDVADDGQITLAEGPLQGLLAGLGVDLSSLTMDAETVQDFVKANIQHIQLDNRPDGLGVYVNGQAMPTLAWDDESLASLVKVLDMTGTDLGPAAKLLPLLPDLGVGVVVRFPANAAAIPLAKLTAPAALGSQNNLQAALSSPAKINIALDYAADGSYQLKGLNPFILNAIPADALKMSGDTLDSVAEMGIKGLSIVARPQGLVVLVNNEPLPYLRSANQEQLLRMIELILQLQGGESAGQYVGLVRQLLPALMTAGLSANVTFPS